MFHIHSADIFLNSWKKVLENEKKKLGQFIKKTFIAHLFTKILTPENKTPTEPFEFISFFFGNSTSLMIQKYPFSLSIKRSKFYQYESTN